MVYISFDQEGRIMQVCTSIQIIGAGEVPYMRLRIRNKARGDGPISAQVQG